MLIALLPRPNTKRTVEMYIMNNAPFPNISQRTCKIGGPLLNDIDPCVNWAQTAKKVANLKLLHKPRFRGQNFGYSRVLWFSLSETRAFSDQFCFMANFHEFFVGLIKKWRKNLHSTKSRIADRPAKKVWSTSYYNILCSWLVQKSAAKGPFDIFVRRVIYCLLLFSS